MDDFDTSSLWRISAFRRELDAGQARDANTGRATLLPTTLMADLQRLESRGASDDVVEVVAACMRNHEAALLYLQYGEYVWPVTLFPRESLYHSPRGVANMTPGPSFTRLTLLGVEPPGVRPPGHVMNERVAGNERYRPLAGLLWAIALQGPRGSLLAEISGRVAYRLVSSSVKDLPPSLGALASAASRLVPEPSSLQEVASWPGMSVERASRLLNALYLTGALMVSRSHPAADREPSMWRRFLGRRS